MFDISFTEMMVIGVVALVVIGPERLPKVARTAGVMFGRLQRYVTDVKADISREIEQSELKDFQKSMKEAASAFETTVKSHAEDINSEVKKAEEEINRLANPEMHFGQGDVASLESVTTQTEAGSDAVEGPSPQMELGLSESQASNASLPLDHKA